MRFPFRRNTSGLQPDTMVATSRSVLRGEVAITLVVHMYSGDWQFMGTDGRPTDDLEVVHFADLLRREPELMSMIGLERGHLSVLTPEGRWKTWQFASDEKMFD